MPTLSIYISTSVTAVAWYGAIVATVGVIVAATTATVQLSSFIRDRARLKIEVHQGTPIAGDFLNDPFCAKYKGMILTVIFVINRGRRPVTVTNVGQRYIYPARGFVHPEVNPPLPHELTEGKRMTVLIDEKDRNPGTRFFYCPMESFWVKTSVGRKIRRNIAPWHRWWASQDRRWQQWQRESKTKVEV